jgi:uncharacterized protein YecE (DUF72 family)
MARIRIGISGWRYAPWRGEFYPRGLVQARELSYAASTFPSIEINGSFYSLQRPQSYARWYADTPADFVFAVKGGRYITHFRKLRDVETPLANFLASGLFCLREKLGPVLWQFPPNFRYERARMEQFFELLPHDTTSAARLARKHDARLRGRAALTPDRKRRLRHAVEIRHESFAASSFIDLLRAHNVALVVAETAGRFPLLEDVTADFVYLRLHGDKELYRSGYGDAALARWAARIQAWARGSEPADARKTSRRKPASAKSRDVYCYFDNTDIKLRAPVDARRLMSLLGPECATTHQAESETYVSKLRNRRKRPRTLARSPVRASARL